MEKEKSLIGKSAKENYIRYLKLKSVRETGEKQLITKNHLLFVSIL